MLRSRCSFTIHRRHQILGETNFALVTSSCSAAVHYTSKFFTATTSSAKSERKSSSSSSMNNNLIEKTLNKQMKMFSKITEKNNVQLLRKMKEERKVESRKSDKKLEQMKTQMNNKFKANARELANFKNEMKLDVGALRNEMKSEMKTRFGQVNAVLGILVAFASGAVFYCFTMFQTINDVKVVSSEAKQASDIIGNSFSSLLSGEFANNKLRENENSKEKLGETNPSFAKRWVNDNILKLMTYQSLNPPRDQSRAPFF